MFNTEQEWDVQKKEYEKFIGHLRGEIGTRRTLSPKVCDIRQNVFIKAYQIE